MKEIQRQLICADGEIIPLKSSKTVGQIRILLGADALSSFTVRDGNGLKWAVMIDDAGHAKDLPVNDLATEFYWSICKPGTTHMIRGDALMQLDFEFAAPDFF